MLYTKYTKAIEESLLCVVQEYEKAKPCHFIVITILCAVTLFNSSPSLFAFFLFGYTLSFVDLIFVCCLRRGVQHQDIHLLQTFGTFSIYKTILINVGGLVVFVVLYLSFFGFAPALRRYFGSYTSTTGYILDAILALFLVGINMGEYETRRLCRIFSNEIEMSGEKKIDV
ncbi:hypothetical protein L596_025341 [Steinernema carpocapsae]|uniref:Uncharacterized protein n=1 Tax=Steinernema carpocapsae TaxID=34508 RepID=A0A4U5M7J9_STECR|nr:hypothetical protein L596_025341 [Steinernema carpocapsae]